jgi:hypothetical protein
VRERLKVVPYQEAPSPPMTRDLREACARAIHVVRADGRVLRAGRACLHIFDRIGYRLTARVCGLPPLVWAVELGYWIVASNRSFFARFLFTRE